MAQVKSKGSIILKILIGILVVALIYTISYPKKVWEEEANNTEVCRLHMDRLLKAELVYQAHNNTYTDSLDGLISFFKNDSTKRAVRDYFMADTSLAEKVVDSFKKTDTEADFLIKNIFADTLMFSLLENASYDSNLARIILDRLENLETQENFDFVDSIKVARSLDSSDVFILNDLDKKFSALEIIQPIEEDDSLKLVFMRMLPDVSIGGLLDTLYVLKETWANKIDSAVFYTLNDFRMCPTVNREYNITVIDTSVIKIINIYCPMDSVDIEANKADFIKYRLGHRRIENHGKIETGEKSWTQ